MFKSSAIGTFALASILVVSPAALADFSGTLSTPEGEGVKAGGNWALVEGGFEISWDVSQNQDGTWNYGYQISAEKDDDLQPALSHIILELSQNISEDDIFNLQGVNAELEFGWFGQSPGNPGFPAGEQIFGVKLNVQDADGQLSFSFDSTRQPMWGDFYSKGGSSSYAYNTDLGVAVANVNDYASPAVDANGDPLFKILVPDTIPTPGSFALLCIAGGLGMGRRRGR